MSRIATCMIRARRYFSWDSSWRRLDCSRKNSLKRYKFTKCSNSPMTQYVCDNEVLQSPLFALTRYHSWKHLNEHMLHIEKWWGHWFCTQHPWYFCIQWRVDKNQLNYNISLRITTKWSQYIFHYHKETSYKDDAECIIYILLHLISKGKLLWYRKVKCYQNRDFSKSGFIPTSYSGGKLWISLRKWSKYSPLNLSSLLKFSLSLSLCRGIKNLITPNS